MQAQARPSPRASFLLTELASCPAQVYVSLTRRSATQSQCPVGQRAGDGTASPGGVPSGDQRARSSRGRSGRGRALLGELALPPGG